MKSKTLKAIGTRVSLAEEGISLLIKDMLDDIEDGTGTIVGIDSIEWVSKMDGTDKIEIEVEW